MMATLLAGGLAALCVFVVLRPFTGNRHQRLELSEQDSGRDRRRELLRQLRDLDEDLEAGKLDEDEHRRMRDPVEHEAAQVLRDAETRTPDHGTGKTLHAGSPGRFRRRRAVWVALPAGAAAGTAVVLVVLLSGALTPRGTSQAATASAAAGSSQKAAGSLTPSGASSKPSSAQPTAAQVAAVDAAAARVRTSPKDVGAHLELAQAYTAAGAAQLSSIEYLAVTQLDHGNAVANTQLALVAFSAGQAAQAKKLVDAALTAHHGYPEALYARGVIELMGLRHTVAGERDLKAYLAAAPHGSHRASVGTLLAISSGLHQ